MHQKCQGHANMTENSQSLQGIIELMDELHTYAGQTVVVKIGGNSIAEDPDFLAAIARQLEFLQSRRIKIVLVHGGGPQIDAALREAGIVPVKGADGRRITDRATMEVVARVMGEISRTVASTLEHHGCRTYTAVASGRCFVQARPLNSGGELDDRTGTPSYVNREAIEDLLRYKQVIVLNSVGRGEDGGDYNVNADDYATAIAVALKARRLILATNVSGVYDADKQPISLLTPPKAEELISSGIIAGGMIPKVQSALNALTSGVGGIAIIDAHKNWALLGELLTKKGFGTLIAPAV